MQFTPQQMMGYKGYSTGVLIGNWSEDIQVQEDKMKSFQVRKAMERSESSDQRLMLAPQRGDGFLHFGDAIMIESVGVEGALSLDLSVKYRPRLNHATVSCPKSTGAPALRNVWIVRKARDEHNKFFDAEKESDIVHYGQHIRIVNEYMSKDGFYSLSSRRRSADCQSRSGRQEVTGCLGGGAYDCVFTIDQSDGKNSIQPQEGNPVPADAAIIITHLASGLPLLCERRFHSFTSFGAEPEVSCHLAKLQETRVNIPQQPENFWRITTAPRGAKYVPYNSSSSLSILERVKAKILQRGGAQGFRGLVKTLRIMDDDGSRTLSRQEFKDGMEVYGIPMSTAELDVVFKAFDVNGDGSISITEFLRTLRGAMNVRRLDIVREAFKRIDKDGSGVVTFGEICDIYGNNLDEHPQVKSGARTKKEIMREFMGAWDKDSDGHITFKEFESYYNDISAGIDSDDYFELMIRNAWHISGGEGWCENTSCRRVLVVHTDDSQTVEELQDDLGIGSEDIDKMKAQLAKQGVTDIKRIELYA